MYSFSYSNTGCCSGLCSMMTEAFHVLTSVFIVYCRWVMYEVFCYINETHITSICYYSGGYDGENRALKTTEFIYLNGSKTEAPIELPEPRYIHCMVEYAGIVILMGGRYVTNSQWPVLVQYLNTSAFLTFQNSLKV